MVSAAVDKAVFLLKDAHQSPMDAQRSLKGYYPQMGFTERLDHVRAAYAVIRGGRRVQRPAVSELQQPSSFMVAHERHGFTD
ncbi:hypothetical protein ACFQVC_33795 [Streptomyces monticola]|uniref:Uncharacterized protein n=1 Tax=Streptomyces monticola TaxID=2666263 RepID=A0ABW2JUU1_9ACTN